MKMTKYDCLICGEKHDRLPEARPGIKVGSALDVFEARITDTRGKPDEPTGVSTGFTELDRLTSGLHPGELVVIAGRPSSGKSAFALNILENVALYGKSPVGLFSLEMEASQVFMRILASFAHVSFSDLRSGEMDDRVLDRVASSVDLVKEAPIFIDDAGGLTPKLLRERALCMLARFDIQLLVVDYIQLMSVDNNHENRSAQLSEISRNLKALAKEMDIPIIVLSQLNRQLEMRDNKRPRLSDLRDSGSIEDDADVVAMIYRDEMYNPESPDLGTAEICIVKQRNGPQGRFSTSFLAKFLRFDNLTFDQ